MAVSSLTVTTLRHSSAATTTRRPHSRSNVLLVAARGGQQAAAEQPQRRVATAASPRLFAGAVGPQGGGAQPSSWLPNLHLFFTSPSSQRRVPSSPSFEAWALEVGLPLEELEEDSHAGHMYFSHLADRMAVASVRGGDEDGL